MPAPPTRGRGSFRNRAMAGGALGLLALGIWIGSWLGEFGFGGRSGDAEREAGNETSPAATTLEEPTEGVSVDLGPATSLSRSPGDARDATSGDAAAPSVSVMIYGDAYRLPRDRSRDMRDEPAPTSAAFTEASLEQVVAEAQEAPGNENGIKVLVYRHRTATVGALNRMVKALREAGVQREQIHELSDFYD